MCLMYRDASQAIAWLCKVFGFTEHAVYRGNNDTILHAELALGGGMIMLGSLDKNDDSAYRRLIRHPDEIGGAGTMSINIIVQDADAAYALAKANGAKILLDIEDKHYGGRGFTCGDLEGYIWNIGTYDPWQPQ